VHVLTHKDLHLHPWRLRLLERPSPVDEPVAQQGQWFSAAEWPGLGLPAPVRRLLEVVTLCSEVKFDPAAEVRKESVEFAGGAWGARLDAALAKLADDLRSSPELRAEIDQVKARALEHPDVQAFAGAFWRAFKADLKANATGGAEAS
jgi:hypothetical protein